MGGFSGWGGLNDILNDALERKRKEDEEKAKMAEVARALAAQRAGERANAWQPPSPPVISLPKPQQTSVPGPYASPHLVDTGTPQLSSSDPYQPTQTSEIEQPQVNTYSPRYDVPSRPMTPSLSDYVRSPIQENPWKPLSHWGQTQPQQPQQGFSVPNDRLSGMYNPPNRPMLPVEPQGPAAHPVQPANPFNDIADWYTSTPEYQYAQEVSKDRNNAETPSILDSALGGFRGAGGLANPTMAPARAMLGAAFGALQNTQWGKEFINRGQDVVDRVLQVPIMTAANEPWLNGVSPTELLTPAAQNFATAAKSVMSGKTTITPYSDPFATQPSDLASAMIRFSNEQLAKTQGLRKRVAEQVAAGNTTANLALRDLPSGYDAANAVFDNLVNKDRKVQDLINQANQLKQTNPVEAGNLFLRAQNLRKMTNADMVDQQMNPWAELGYGIAFDVVSPMLGLVTHGLGLVPEAGALRRAERLMNVTEEGAIAKLGKAAEQGAALRGGLAEGPARAQEVYKGIVAPFQGLGEKIADNTWILKQTPESKAALDTDVLWGGTTRILGGAVTRQDYAKILDTLMTDPQQLVKGVAGLSPEMVQRYGSADGLVRWGASVANDDFVRRLPILGAVRDEVLAMKSLGADVVKVNPYEFFAELNGHVADAARRANGAKLKGLPFGATKVELARIGADAGAVVYLDKNGKVIAQGVETSLVEAQRRVNEIKKIAVAKPGAGEIAYKFAKAPTDIQRAIMSDIWLGMRPENWKSNAASAALNLLANDSWTLIPNKVAQEYLGAKGLATMPSQRMADIAGFETKLTKGIKDELSSGAIDWTASKLTRNPDNLVSRGMKALYDIPYGSTEIKLPGGLAIPVGEGAFYTRAYYVPFKRTFDAGIVNDINKYLVPELQQIEGMTPEMIQNIGDFVESTAKTGSRSDVALGIRSYVGKEKIGGKLKSLNVAPEVLSPSAYRAIERIMSDASPSEAAQAMTEISRILNGERNQAASVLSLSPGQPGFSNWTDHDMAQHTAWMADHLAEDGVKAGLEPAQAAQEAKDLATKHLQAQQDMYKRVLDDLAAAPNNPHTWDIVIDFWHDINKDKMTARSVVDGLSRRALELGTPEGWLDKWEGTKRIYGAAPEHYASLGDATRTALNEVHNGGVYTPRHDWFDTLDKYMNFDEQEFQAARALELGSPSLEGSAEFQQRIKANRNFLDNSLYDLLGSFQQHPSLENFDIVVKGMQRIEAEGARVAFELAELRKKLATGGMTKDAYAAIRNRLWDKFHDEGVALNGILGKHIIRNGILEKAGKDLKWTEEAGGDTWQLARPSETPDKWWGRNTRTNEEQEFTVADKAAQAGTPFTVPKSVVDDYNGLLGNEAAVDNAADRAMAEIRQSAPVQIRPTPSASVTSPLDMIVEYSDGRKATLRDELLYAGWTSDDLRTPQQIQEAMRESGYDDTRNPNFRLVPPETSPVATPVSETGSTGRWRNVPSDQMPTRSALDDHYLGTQQSIYPVEDDFSPFDPFAPGREATWRVNDSDQPVTITGKLGEHNGEAYYSIEGSSTGVPESQLITPTPAPKPEPVAPTPGQDVEFMPHVKLPETPPTTIPTNEELRKLASENGIPTASKDGRGTDKQLINSLNKRINSSATKLDDLTDIQRLAARDALKARGVEQAALPLEKRMTKPQMLKEYGDQLRAEGLTDEKLSKMSKPEVADAIRKMEAKPAAAPSGQPKLVGYEWRSTSGERFSSHDGGLVGAKVSDWNQSEISKGSGREIVHVYWVEEADGTVHAYGKQTALERLGVSDSNLKKSAQRYMNEVEHKRQIAEQFAKDLPKRPHAATEREAVSEYAKWQQLPYNKSAYDNNAVYVKDGKYVVIPDNEEWRQVAEAAGYKLNSPAAKPPTTGTANMFGDTAEDLPTISGMAPTAPKGKGAFVPQDATKTESMFDMRPQMGSKEPSYKPKGPKPTTIGDAAKSEMKALEDARDSMRREWERVATGSNGLPKLDTLIARFKRGGAINLNLDKGEIKLFEDLYGNVIDGQKIDNLSDVEHFLNQYSNLKKQIDAGAATVDKSKQFARMSAQAIVKEVRPELEAAGYSAAEITELAKDRRGLLDTIATLRGDQPDEFGMVGYDFAVPSISHMLGMENPDEAFRTWPEWLKRSRKNGSNVAPQMADIAQHQILGINELEQTLKSQLPRLLEGEPNTLTGAQKMRVVDTVLDFLPRFDDNVATAQMVGQHMADWMMLNYNDKRNLDSIMALLTPYSYFWSRMPSRVAMAALSKPALVNAYYQYKRSVGLENKQAEIPDRLQGTLPVPWDSNARVNTSASIDRAFPAMQYLQPNPFVEDADNDNMVESWAKQLEKHGPGLSLGAQFLLDILDGKLDKDYSSVLNNMIPVPLIGAPVSSLYQEYTGNMPAHNGVMAHFGFGPDTAMDDGFPLDAYRARRAVTWIGQEENIDPTLLGYAQQVIINQYEGKEVGENIPPDQLEAALALAQRGVKRAAEDRIANKVSAYTGGLAVSPYTGAEQEMTQAKNRYNASGYSESNPDGSKELQKDILAADQGAQRAWSKSSETPGIDGQISTLYDKGYASGEWTTIMPQIDALKAQKAGITGEPVATEASTKGMTPEEVTATEQKKAAQTYWDEYHKIPKKDNAAKAAFLRDNPEFAEIYKQNIIDKGETPEDWWTDYGGGSSTTTTGGAAALGGGAAAVSVHPAGSENLTYNDVKADYETYYQNFLSHHHEDGYEGWNDEIAWLKEHPDVAEYEWRRYQKKNDKLPFWYDDIYGKDAATSAAPAGRGPIPSNPTSVADVLRQPYDAPTAGATELGGGGGGGRGGGNAYSKNWDEYHAFGDDNDAKRKYMLSHPDFAKYYIGKYGDDSAWWLKGRSGGKYGKGGGGYSQGAFAENWDEYHTLDGTDAKRKYLLDNPKFADAYLAYIRTQDPEAEAWWLADPKAGRAAFTPYSYGGGGGGGYSGGGGGGFDGGVIHNPHISPTYMNRDLWNGPQQPDRQWIPYSQPAPDWLRVGQQLQPDPIRKWIPPRIR